MRKTFGIALIALMALSLMPLIADAAPEFGLNDSFNWEGVTAYAPPPGKGPGGGGGGGSSAQIKDWGYMRMGGDAPRASVSGTVTVAVLDTGIDPSHADLAGLLVACFSGIKRTDASCDSRDVTDDNGHGTHVAGTIAALDNSIDSVGFASGHVNLINGKVLGKRGGGWDDLSWSIRHAADLGADVISMSLGGNIAGYDSIIADLDAAVAYAQGKGAVVLAAAGNEGTCDAGDEQWSWPAANKGVISVGATGLYANGGFVTEWTGAEEDVMPCFSNQAPHVDLSAPGVYITASKRGGGVTEMSGTSMATPYAAAFAALLLLSGVNSGNVEGRMKTSTVDMGYPSTLQGAGLIVW